MAEVGDESVQLVVTSPPYWQIKDYGAAAQIGFGQSLHEYLYDLARVWQECWRVLEPGRRLCINIGDQFARTAVYGRYQVIPLHAEIIAQCSAVGFDYLGAIIWQKSTTMETSGGATIMGSFPHPPNGLVTLDYEYILLFKKPGPPPKIDKATKDASRLTKEEWKEYFSGHWVFSGVRQKTHEAMFPLELPRRLIRMFSFAGETVLDPFMGSGTTAQAALELGRSAIGYELQEEFLQLIRERLGFLMTAESQTLDCAPVALTGKYVPHIADANQLAEIKAPRPKPGRTAKVTSILGPTSLELDDGSQITLLGIKVEASQHQAATEYLGKFVRRKKVRVVAVGTDDPSASYLYLSNAIFINRKMIEMGIARCDEECQHRFSGKFLALEAAVAAGSVPPAK